MSEKITRKMVVEELNCIMELRHEFAQGDGAMTPSLLELQDLQNRFNMLSTLAGVSLEALEYLYDGSGVQNSPRRSGHELQSHDQVLVEELKAVGLL